MEKDKQMEKGRFKWVDTAKALGIYLMILSHCRIEDNVSRFINVFHMPLFFFISGYLFSACKYPSAGSLARKRFQRLVKPYILFNVIGYVLWLVLLRHYGYDAASGIEWWEPIVGGALCIPGGMMPHNEPLWFLVCLFITEIAYYVSVRKTGSRWAVICIFAVLGGANYYLNQVCLPFCISTVFVAVVFYALGNILRDAGGRHGVVWLVLSLAVAVWMSVVNGYVFVAIGVYGNYLLFYIGALSGIYFIYCVAKMLPYNRFVRFVSDNTLMVLGIHIFVMAFVKGVMIYVLGMDIRMLDLVVLPNILFGAVSFAISLAVAFAYGKYVPDRVRKWLGL